MPRRALNNICYVTIPPLSGQELFDSHRFSIYNAETIVQRKATLALDLLEKDALQTQVWVSYNELWTSMINQTLLLTTDEDTPVIIIVPSKCVGIAGGWHDFGVAAIARSEWGANVVREKLLTDDINRNMFILNCIDSAFGLGAAVFSHPNGILDWLCVRQQLWADFVKRQVEEEDGLRGRQRIKDTEIRIYPEPGRRVSAEYVSTLVTSAEQYLTAPSDVVTNLTRQADLLSLTEHGETDEHLSTDQGPE